MVTTTVEKTSASSDTAQTGPRRSAALRRTAIAGAAALAIWGAAASFYAVDVSEYAVVTRFGGVVRVVAEPGLHVAAPIDRVIRLERRTLFARIARSEYLTMDKKNIVVESLATWRIVDPVRFLAAVGARGVAEERLSEAVSSAIGSEFGHEPAAALISPDPAGTRYAAVTAAIRTHVDVVTRPAYGIEVVAVDLRRLSLPDQNQEHVFDRMKAERARIAKENRSSGELEAKRITARAEREKTVIEAEAASEARRLRAEADAVASRTYADAAARDPALYRFVRTLDAYERIIDDKTTLFLPGDAEVLRFLRFDPERGQGSASPADISSPRAASGGPPVPGDGR
jgi:membrane protease subunit HflC